MDTLLIIVLIAFIAGVVLSGRRESVQPQIIYIQTEPQTSTGSGCLLPLILVVIVLLLLFVAG